MDVDTASLAATRRQIAALLRRHKAEDVIPPSAKLVLLDEDVTLATAFATLEQNELPYAPVVNTASKRVVCSLSRYDALFRLPSDTTIRTLRANKRSIWGEICLVSAESSLLDVAKALARGMGVVLMNGDSPLYAATGVEVMQLVRSKLPPLHDALLSTPVSELGLSVFAGTVDVRVDVAEKCEAAIAGGGFVGVAEGGRVVGVWGGEGGRGCVVGGGVFLGGVLSVLQNGVDVVFVEGVGGVRVQDLLRVFVEGD